MTVTMYCCGTGSGHVLDWEVVALGSKGPFRLTMRSSTGSIVEYFPTPTAALCRQTELEHILIAIRRGWANGIAIGNC